MSLATVQTPRSTHTPTSRPGPLPSAAQTAAALASQPRAVDFPSPDAAAPQSVLATRDEVHATLMGAGLLVGVVAGAAVGGAVWDFVGVLLGSSLGGVSGALGGGAAGRMAAPTPETSAPPPAHSASGFEAF